MTKKNKEKAIYLVTNADKKAPLISLYSLPTKCLVCHTFQEPEPLSFQYSNDYNDAMVQLRCKNETCKLNFTAFYLKGKYGNEQYHFLCFYPSPAYH
ncbi:hypothetical protein ACNRWW_13945 [Metabacillus sp. HB246100]